MMDDVRLLETERAVLRWFSNHPDTARDGDNYPAYKEVFGPYGEKQQQTMLSLARFGYLDWTGWTFTITDAGIERAKTLVPWNGYTYRPCCSNAVTGNCVCNVKYVCVLHGSRCNGTHD